MRSPNKQTQGLRSSSTPDNIKQPQIDRKQHISMPTILFGVNGSAASISNAIAEGGGGLLNKAYYHHNPNETIHGSLCLRSLQAINPCRSEKKTFIAASSQ